MASIDRYTWSTDRLHVEAMNPIWKSKIAQMTYFDFKSQKGSAMKIAAASLWQSNTAGRHSWYPQADNTRRHGQR